MIKANLKEISTGYIYFAEIEEVNGLVVGEFAPKNTKNPHISLKGEKDTLISYVQKKFSLVPISQ